MVQLSPSHTLPVTQDSADGEDRHGEQLDTISNPKVEDLPEGLNSPQVSLEVSTAYHGYETYIEDGLICLKHKVRNLEKKKVKCLLCTSKHRRKHVSCTVHHASYLSSAEAEGLPEKAETGGGAQQRSDGET